MGLSILNGLHRTNGVATPNRLDVRVQGLRQTFGKTQALVGIDLVIGSDVFGLLGPNGAGKTTLLRTLATTLAPDEGTVRLLGFDPGHPKERRELRRRLGYLPQALGYYPNFTVFEFVEYFALLKEMPSPTVRSAVVRAIKRVDLTDQATKKLKTLSGGMLRRVGIAQAIVNDPTLLLLDEPTADLDPEQRVAVRSLLREVGAKAVVVVSTHLIEDVAAACTDVGLLERGRIVFHGPPAALVAAGDGHAAGDSPLERGYSRILAEARA